MRERLVLDAKSLYFSCKSLSIRIVIVTDFSQNTNSALDEISFSASDVRNDVTGNWRISTIADNIDMVDYAIEYYNKYFESDDEIHAIVNFNYNTTTKISVIGNLRFFYISFHKNAHSPLPVFHPEESASGRHFYRKMTVRNMRKNSADILESSSSDVHHWFVVRYPCMHSPSLPLQQMYCLQEN